MHLLICMFTVGSPLLTCKWITVQYNRHMFPGLNLCSAARFNLFMFIWWRFQPHLQVWQRHKARKLNKEDAMDHCKWRKVIKEARWSGWVWVGECFFWYRPARVVPDQRPLNGRCCYCCCCCCYAMGMLPVYQNNALKFVLEQVHRF